MELDFKSYFHIQLMVGWVPSCKLSCLFLPWPDVSQAMGLCRAGPCQQVQQLGTQRDTCILKQQQKKRTALKYYNIGEDEVGVMPNQEIEIKGR